LEGPECRFIAKALAEKLTGKTIVDIFVRKPSAARYSKHPLTNLKDKKVRGVFCKGKNIVLNCEPYFAVVHLGMSAYFSAKAPQNDKWFKSVSFSIALNTGEQLFCHDERGFGSVRFFMPGEEITPISELAPEVFDAEFTPEFFLNKAKGQKTEVKPFLLNQKAVCCGLGNIYVAEILWLAGISPFKKTCDITLDQASRICESARVIIAQADYTGTSAIQTIAKNLPRGGGMSSCFSIYQKDRCANCGAATTCARQNGRATWYCSFCQKEGW